MEKYLIILIVAFVVYYTFKCFNQTKEGFADAQTVDGIDESNSINTLAKIAKDIMDGGGLKVAGRLQVTGAKSTPAGSGDMLTHFNHSDGNNYIRGNTFLNGNLNVVGPISSGDFNINSQLSKIGPEKNKFTLHTPDDGRKGLWITPSKDDANSDWLWGYSLNLKRDGNHYLGGNLTAAGNLDIKGKLTFNGGQPAMIYKDYGAGRYVGTDTGVDGNYQAAFGWVTANCWEQTVTQLYFADGRWRFHAYNSRYGDGGCAGVAALRIYFFHNNLF